MPATEQTWRDMKALHVVFGVSSILLLVTTVAMLAADHSRPWKVYQRGFRDLETWSAAAKVAEQDSRDFENTLKRLEEALAAERSAPLDAGMLAAFLEEVRTSPEDKEAADLVQLDADRLATQADPSERLVLRGDLFARMRDIVSRTKFREDLLAGTLKLRKAELDKARADYELAVADEAPSSTLDALLGIADAKRSEVSSATLANQASNSHRKRLEELLRGFTRPEDEAEKAVADHRQQLAMLAKSLQDRAPNLGKTILELPVLDAFNGPLRIDQIWLPKLTLNNNFRDVARFDRCVTCHKGIDKAAPGAPSQQLYCDLEGLTLSLATPRLSKDEVESYAELKDDGNDQLEDLFGLRLAPRGLFASDDPTINVVVPQGLAAKSGLRVGDVISAVDGVRTLSRRVAAESLLDGVRAAPVDGDAPARSLSIGIRRGVPQPYASHPRLDLFVGSTSPHPMQTFGCTICHEGQGSATSFKWASHTPNSPKEGLAWHDEHGWFDNHHWIFPMLSERFEQSSCLKCHHQVVDLEPSERFPEPPAEKLVEGYHTIRQYGCYGCHEINGYAGPDKRIGPDMRLTPNYHEVAQAVLSDPALAGKRIADGGQVLSELARNAREVAASPDGKRARDDLREMIDRDATGEDPVLSPRTHELAVLLKEPETPGNLSKVGPSLRHLSDKFGRGADGFEWLYAWLRNPRDFRPSTKMPRFFGLWEHLSGKGLAESQRYEPVEIRSMIAYLDAASQPFEYVKPFEGVLPPDAERGKKVVEVRGCLACHQHADFPLAANRHGPDLSRVGAKFAANPNGGAWLYSWLREPSRHHPKTLMPNLLLEPVKLPDGSLADPAADATAYLMQSTQDWRPDRDWRIDTLDGSRPFPVVSAGALSADERAALQELVVMYLKDRFPAVKAEAYATEGLPESLGSIKGDERMLLGLPSGQEGDAKLLEYVGKKTLAKLACYSCHDIPGFEDAKPAGAALADWGRKESSKIAFEQVSHFVMHSLHGNAHGAAGHGNAHGAAGGHGFADHAPTQVDHEPSSEDLDPAVASDLAYAMTDEPHVDVASLAPDTGYFVERLLAHDRQGVLWQKLRAPRSYDFKKAENKSYNERYRMPQFPFDDAQREAVMTFVLGLVAEPPSPQFVHTPGPREQSRLDGLVVAERYNCGGCHVLEMDRWDVRYRPESMGEPVDSTDYPFLSPHFPQQAVARSLVLDRQGRRSSSLRGMPVIDPATGRPMKVDEEGVPLEENDTESAVHHPFMLFEDVLVDGAARGVGGPNLIVPDDALQAGQRFPPRGGDLARLLFPVVIADEKKINPNVKADDAWGWLPPPLVGEGRKVQTGWLHKFLLNPHPIRPAAVLRMPRFHFGSDESAKLVDYFASVDDAEYPYDYDPRYQQSSLAAVEAAHPGHLGDALKIVTNGNYCVKCHLVGDYAPPGNPKALAPQLSTVHERLRPDYIRGWIANPKRYLPYTGMPVNIPVNQPVSQNLYAGSSEEQVDALTDLLMHFDRFAKDRFSVEAFIKQQPGPAAAAVLSDAPSDASPGSSGRQRPTTSSKPNDSNPSARVTPPANRPPAAGIQSTAFSSATQTRLNPPLESKQ
ncbi:MAG: PDZ domain-containing protein [Planctomycetaceae bacterium]